MNKPTNSTITYADCDLQGLTPMVAVILYSYNLKNKSQIKRFLSGGSSLTSLNGIGVKSANKIMLWLEIQA